MSGRQRTRTRRTIAVRDMHADAAVPIIGPVVVGIYKPHRFTRIGRMHHIKLQVVAATLTQEPRFKIHFGIDMHIGKNQVPIARIHHLAIEPRRMPLYAQLLEHERRVASHADAPAFRSPPPRVFRLNAPVGHRYTCADALRAIIRRSVHARTPFPFD